jgi:hypothetical protein
VKRYGTEMVEREVIAEVTCDGCGWTSRYASGFITVVICVHEDEEGGARDEFDYCDDCLVERAPALMAAGSTAPLVNGDSERAAP